MLKTIATYHTSLDAHVAKTMLESEGIPAVVIDEHMNMLYANVAGGSRLQVVNEYADKALNLLDINSTEN